MAASMFWKIFPIFSLLCLNFLILCSCSDLNEVSQQDVCSIKSCIPHTMPNTSVVHEYCTNRSLTISGRCCYDGNGTVFGVDLASCKMHHIDHIFKEFTHLEWIALENNPLKVNNTNVSSEHFRGLSAIEYLSLPGGFTCPGGSSAWNTTMEKENITICVMELDTCVVKNATEKCPDNSHCVADGPGVTQCLCDDGFHGYKCLKQGYFPMVIYYATLCGVTLLVGLLLWITQRRKALKID